MKSGSFGLPEYPCRYDVWDRLRDERRPIVVYGMGNGADKLFARFSQYGIRVADVFASDGFVRGHEYRQYRVKSFSEIREKYSDFVIVLSFASRRPEVIEMLSGIDKEYDMYIPDMPVVGEEYFDREFYNSNYESLCRVADMLCDDESARIFSEVLAYRLTGKMEHLLSSCSDPCEMYSLIRSGKPNMRVAVDAGAYNGDTVREMIMNIPSLEKIYALEPDPKTYKRLFRTTEEYGDRVEPVNAAAWSACGTGSFMSSGNRNSSLVSHSHEYREGDVKLVPIDSVADSADYVKYDVEGAELEALVGTRGLIEKSRPVLLVSAYHRSRDIFTIPMQVLGEHDGYRLYLRRLRSIPAWELNYIFLPET